ncbi:hypothetical protein QAD02_020026 [Eretmocerus hayati]|uniref:Uncharacterized protein n=1 Tax=Eretmocerus hayati TaxID=131215 RepID=A0ACC2PKZ7_9HYME|nr:hypothetical protein QAD02_020026 [Eretmocerus hayati]
MGDFNKSVNNELEFRSGRQRVKTCLRTARLGAKIGPQNMISISRIAGGRICIYLATEEAANTLIKVHKSVNINDYTLPIRPLNAKTKRILISNVHTSVPNSAIEEIFASYNVPLKSHITRLRTGLQDIGYTHLLSHRRQVYIDAQDTDKLPESCKLEHEGVTYWLYISAEKLTCFLCKEEGHRIKNCQNVAPHGRDTAPTLSEPASNEVQDPSQESSSSEAAEDGFETVTYRSNKKRLPSGSVSTNKIESPETLKKVAVPDEIVEKKGRSTTHPPKKQKTDSSYSQEEIWTMVQPIEKKYTEDTTTGEIELQELVSFLTETHGKVDTLSNAANLSKDFPAIISGLEMIYPHLDTTLNQRATRIVKKLGKEGGASAPADIPLPPSSSEEA